MSQTTCIRLPDDLVKKIKVRASVEHRSVSNQIESFLRLIIIAEENPDLPLKFIKDILQAKAEKEMGLAKPFEI